MADCQDLINAINNMANNICAGQDNITTQLYTMAVDFNAIRYDIELSRMYLYNIEIDLANMELVSTDSLLVQDNQLIAQQDLEGHFDTLGSIGVPVATIAIQSEFIKQAINNNTDAINLVDSTLGNVVIQLENIVTQITLIENSVQYLQNISLSLTSLDSIIDNMDSSLSQMANIQGGMLEALFSLYSIDYNLGLIKQSIDNISIDGSNINIDLSSLNNCISNLQGMLNDALFNLDDDGIATIVQDNGELLNDSISSLNIQVWFPRDGKVFSIN